MQEVSTTQGYRLKVYGEPGETAAYLRLPRHPQTPGCVAKTLRLHSVVEYAGAEINIDFDATGAVIGIEILD